jgi:phosphatidylserine/phosphatidylglycerophosphate/cardiolipin synthase-like enzyme
MEMAADSAGSMSVGGAASVARQSPGAILQPGRNCWRAAKATRAALLPDAASYFVRLRQAFRQAERSILIIGWDFDSRIKLCPQEEVCASLGPMLRELVEAKPDLHVRILVWSLAVVHGPSATSELLVNADWQDHPRITLRLDHEHPVYAAHHQKIVCVDDRIAFTGGIDLTVKRWDTWRHKPGDRRRKDPDGDLYSPVQDMQMIVEGDVAGVVADVAKMRWKRALGEDLPHVASAADLWPKELEPQFTDTEVAVARTMPSWRTYPPAQEIGTLTLDAISAARHCIYFEAQYFANFEVADRLAESLARPEGPEVVVLMSHKLPGKLEQFIMGRNRDRVLRQLMRADRYGRFGGYYTVSPSPHGEVDILIHAKLMIVDDVFLRVGSANINNRSVGLDTECDLAIEAANDQQREAIARIRRQLLAGHLHVTPEELAEETRQRRSTIATIRALRRPDGGLHDFATVHADGPTGPVFGTGILDPKEPLAERWLPFWKNWHARFAHS